MIEIRELILHEQIEGIDVIYIRGNDYYGLKSIVVSADVDDLYHMEYQLVPVLWRWVVDLAVWRLRARATKYLKAYLKEENKSHESNSNTQHAGESGEAVQ